MRTIWIAEAFTLSNIVGLSDRLASIPRSAHGFGGADVERALQTLQDFPASLTGGGWISLGVIVRGRGGAFELDPPAGVERVWLWLHGLLPSLTVLVAAFVFTEDDAEERTRLLRQQWETRLSNKQLLTPDFRKERAIRALRYQRKREFSTWLSETFGVRGVFASGVLEGGRYPATEWWTTRIARPLDPNRTALDADYMRILDLARPFHVWTAEGLGGQRMIEAETDAAERDAPSYSLVIARREAEIFEGNDMQTYGGRTTEGFLNRMAIDVSGVTALWALHCVMRAYERRLATAREVLLGLDVDDVRRSLKVLQSEQTNLTLLTGDLVPLTRDILDNPQQLERATRFYSDLEIVSAKPDPVPDASPTPEPLRIRIRRAARSLRQATAEGGVEEGPASWATLVAQWLDERAKRAVAREESLRVLAASVSTVLGARATLKLQRQLLILTIILLVVALATLWVAYRTEKSPGSKTAAAVASCYKQERLTGGLPVAHSPRR